MGRSHQFLNKRMISKRKAGRTMNLSAKEELVGRLLLRLHGYTAEESEMILREADDKINTIDGERF